MGMREEFENDPHFKGMDFSRSVTHPEYYESPYANGAWEGWQYSRAALVIELPKPWAHYSIMGDATDPDMVLDHSTVIQALTAAGVTINTTTVSEGE